MDSRTIFLLSVFFSTIGLNGCQTIKTDSTLLPSSDTSHKISSVTWEKSGELFYKPSNDTLGTNKSRVVVFRNVNSDKQLNSINIGIGPDNAFQVSLQDGHYSDNIICSGSQVINAGVLNKKSGKIISHSQYHQFTPQMTTYLQVDLSKEGIPNIQQIPADKALTLLSKTTRQTHQISRVLSDCTLFNSASLQQPIKVTTVDTSLEIKNPAQFKVLFDFDSATIKSNHSTVFDDMANYIKSYPKMVVNLEGHTDSKGPESYNLKLSQSRSNTVKSVLVDQYGIEAMRLNAIGYGETRPVDTNNTEQGRQNNRRVIAVVSKENK